MRLFKRRRRKRDSKAKPTRNPYSSPEIRVVGKLGQPPHEKDKKFQKAIDELEERRPPGRDH